MSVITRLSPAKMAERIEVFFGMEILGSSRNIVLVGDPDTPCGGEGGFILYFAPPVLMRQMVPYSMRLSLNHFRHE